MYWWNVFKLPEELREGRVGEKEQFKYYLATFAALSILVPVFFYSVGPLRIDDLIYLIASGITGAVCIILCFRANKSGDNIDFIPRMICLSWMGICGFLILSVIQFVIHSVAVVPHELSAFLSYMSDVPQRIRDSWDSWGSFPAMPVLVLVYYGILYFNLVCIARATEGRILVEMVTTDLSLGKAALGLLMLPGSMIICAVTESHITEHAGSEVIAHLAGLAAAGLWLISIGWIFAVVHKRAMKHC